MTSMVEVKMTMENQEEVLDALNCFEKKPSDEIPPILEQYLRQIAKTGETLFPWPKLKSLFITKLDRVMKKFHQEMSTDIPKCPNVDNTKFEEMRERILETVEQFQGAPFTIQRLCELLTEPMRHYQRSDKFLRGIEKNVLVVSTVDPFGRKIVSENRNMVNGLDGLDMNGYNGGQGDAPPVTQYSAFPSSQLTNQQVDKNSVMKITEQCDEMPEAENEKILKDIMETEKSQTHNDSLPQEETTQPFSASTDAETTCDAEQDASETTANNNAKSETQNYFGEVKSESENSDNNINDTSDGNYITQDQSDSTDMNRVHTENLPVLETVSEKEQYSEETPQQENLAEQEEKLVNSPRTTSTCNVEETSSSEDVTNCNNDNESISSSNNDGDNHNTQEIQSSNTVVNTQTNDTTAAISTQYDKVDVLATSGIKLLLLRC
ncbi:hypothetical protein KUTeg_020643 [Tegillarca granosa]|uniref:Serine/threonine-protein phosphatase 4 regulatory subunit 2 n=1 Tax=Tegillarca granosa TaxID=220873 RepID=A0ABQ9E8H7_TEGGR|nr:hypothetical protein KUTeg_020643 [Tegillarca granosa]